MKKLTIYFYNVGKGDCALIKFPGGQLGVVDCHAKSGCSRDWLAQKLRNKTLEFVCLTHGHADHVLGLAEIVKDDSIKIKYFLNSIPEIHRTIQFFQQDLVFPPGLNKIRTSLYEREYKPILDLYEAIMERQKNDDNFKFIDVQLGIPIYPDNDISINFLSPSSEFINRYNKKMNKFFQSKGDYLIDRNIHNKISASFAINYAGNIVLLGGDLIAEGWLHANKEYHRLQLPCAKIIKLPHHGSNNAFGNQSKNPLLKTCNPSVIKQSKFVSCLHNL